MGMGWVTYSDLKKLVSELQAPCRPLPLQCLGIQHMKTDCTGGLGSHRGFPDCKDCENTAMPYKKHYSTLERATLYSPRVTRINTAWQIMSHSKLLLIHRNLTDSIHI